MQRAAAVAVASIHVCPYRYQCLDNGLDKAGRISRVFRHFAVFRRAMQWRATVVVARIWFRPLLRQRCNYRRFFAESGGRVKWRAAIVAACFKLCSGIHQRPDYVHIVIECGGTMQWSKASVVTCLQLRIGVQQHQNSGWSPAKRSRCMQRSTAVIVERMQVRSGLQQGYHHGRIRLKAAALWSGVKSSKLRASSSAPASNRVLII